jgi:hypothetical protein
MAFIIGRGLGMLEGGMPDPESGLNLENPAAPDLIKIPPKIQKQMVKRGWTNQDILDVVKNGQRSQTVDYTSPTPAATQYLDPATGRFVVVNNTTGKIVQVSDTTRPFAPNRPVQ